MNTCYLIIFLPFVGFLISGLLSSFIGARGAEIVTSLLCGISAIFSWILFFFVYKSDFSSITLPLMRFIEVGAFKVDWSFRLDTLTIIMLVVVTTVSTFVHIYSIGYMSKDPHRPRFFSYLSFFTFSMLLLVSADNLLQMFLGWEAVGFASFLLIGFWYQKYSANAAAIKAFVINRVGDFGFILGILGIYILFGSVDFDTIFSQVHQWNLVGNLDTSHQEAMMTSFLGWDIYKTSALDLVCFFLFLGAMGKSAQVPLHTWLPDAMEGPTPVSALIHAATMVTAGIFMICRLSPLFQFAPITLTIIVFMGCLTAFLAACVALVQNDIKRIIAWSTCSQLGFMFVAVGCGAYAVAMFHLFTHAFFKALLFLGAGSVIHAVSGEQDIRKMGNLRKHIPFTYLMMLIGTLSITGVGIPYLHIGFAGFVSKDAILETVFLRDFFAKDFIFWILLITACFTSFYSWRLFFMTFCGTCRVEENVLKKIHESPLVMSVPLILLSLGAIFSGFFLYNSFIGDGYQEFWKAALFSPVQDTLLKDLHHVPMHIKIFPLVSMMIGFLIAYLLCLRFSWIARWISTKYFSLHQTLLHAFYFDLVYEVLFVRSFKKISLFLGEKGDKFFIDGFGPHALCSRVIRGTNQIIRMQTGYIHHYAFVMFLALTGFITWIMIENFIL